jgi:hypothetical protein
MVYIALATLNESYSSIENQRLNLQIYIRDGVRKQI